MRAKFQASTRRAELAEFENLMRRATIRRLMVDAGVTFIDPSHAYISAQAIIGRDCVIYPGVSIEGNSVWAKTAKFDPALALQILAWETM